MPATARMRASRVVADPPVRSSVRAIAPRAPRAKRSEAVAARAATGIAQTASRSAKPEIFRVSSIPTGIAAAATMPKRKASHARTLSRRGCIRVWVRTANSAGHCRRPEDGELVGYLQPAAAEPVDRGGPAAAAAVTAPPPRFLQQLPTKQHAPEGRRAPRMPPGSGIEVAQLGERGIWGR